MKTNPIRLIFVSTLALAVVAPSSFAQRQLGKKKGPVSKVYMAEFQGESEIQNGDKIYTVRQATAFDAPGTVIQTKAGSHMAIVLSNGTGIYLGSDTQIKIERFQQEQFPPSAKTLEEEPSSSQTMVRLANGFLGISGNKMATGSSMLYATEHGEANVRGKSIAMETNPENTVVYLLEGSTTVTTKGLNPVSRILQPGEQATIWPGPPPSIVVHSIPDSKRQELNRLLGLANLARNSVTFATIARKLDEGGLDAPYVETPPAADKSVTSEASPEADSGGSLESEAAGADEEADQEIVARPIVPETPPTNIVVSPDRLPGT